MSRALKPKNNDYIDSTGVVYNKKTLDTILSTDETNISNILAKSILKLDGFYLGDYSTKAITLKANRVYLFFNTHTDVRCIILLTTYAGNTDIIYKSNDLAVPTITHSGTSYTFKINYACRGYLYELSGDYSA